MCKSSNRQTYHSKKEKLGKIGLKKEGKVKEEIKSNNKMKREIFLNNNFLKNWK